MTTVDSSVLFDADLRRRFDASRAATLQMRASLINEVCAACDAPRLGTSGAANAYVVLVGSEFGMGGRQERPVYSPHEMGEKGWSELWQLRVGEANPHFDPRWRTFRENTVLWKRLYDWLPDAFGDRDLAHASFAWANLSVTAGGKDLGTERSHHAGFVTHLLPFINAAHARIVGGTNEPVMQQLREWTAQGAATLVEASGLECVRLELAHGPVLVAKVGHPSRGVSRVEFVRRLKLLLELAEEGVQSPSVGGASPERKSHEQPPAAAKPRATLGKEPPVSGFSLEVQSWWIKTYLDDLVRRPPSGRTVTPAMNGRYPGLRIRGGQYGTDLWAHDDHIRVGIHTTEAGVFKRLQGFVGFDVAKPARKYFTGYVRNPQGLAAVNWLVRGESQS